MPASDLAVYDLQGQIYSCVEVSILIGLLLGSCTVGFIVAGCSCGQGMMLACNSVPGVLCGMINDQKDAELFVSINRGNAVSLPLKEGYGWNGEDNLMEIMGALFSLPIENRIPFQDAQRKLADTQKTRSFSQCDLTVFLNLLDESMITKIISASQVMAAIVKDGRKDQIVKWVKDHA